MVRCALACARVHTQTCMRTHMCKHYNAHVHAHTCTHMKFIYTCTHITVHTHTCTHTQLVHTCTFIQTYTNVHTYEHNAHIYMYTHIHIHIHIHTQVSTQACTHRHTLFKHFNLGCFRHLLEPSIEKCGFAFSEVAQRTPGDSSWISDFLPGIMMHELPRLAILCVHHVSQTEEAECGSLLLCWSLYPSAPWLPSHDGVLLLFLLPQSHLL